MEFDNPWVHLWFQKTFLRSGLDFAAWMKSYILDLEGAIPIGTMYGLFSYIWLNFYDKCR